MTPTRTLNRRSFFTQIMGGAVLTVAAATVIGAPAAAAGTAEELDDQVTDRDSGRNADPPGRGRSRRRQARSGYTDSDPRDPEGNGRGRINANRNCTDSDAGQSSDPPGRSRFCRRR